MAKIPEIVIKEFEKQIKKRVCDKIREQYNLNNKPIKEEFGDTSFGYCMVNAKHLKNFLDKIENE